MGLNKTKLFVYSDDLPYNISGAGDRNNFQRPLRMDVSLDA